MAVHYLKHAVHGAKVASTDLELKYDLTLGWELFDPTVKEEIKEVIDEKGDISLEVVDEAKEVSEEILEESSDVLPKTTSRRKKMD